MNQWVCVSDQMPEEDTQVLIATGDDRISIGYYTGTEWRDFTIDSEYYELVKVEVTHWMRMPEHPNLTQPELFP